jgi:dihydropteroate synthase
VTATLPHNPRVVAAPGDAALAGEIARFVGHGPPVGDWFLKLERVPADQAVVLNRVAIRHGGGALLGQGEDAADLLLRVPGDCLGVCLDALETDSGLPDLADAIRSTTVAWRRTSFRLRCGGGHLDLGGRTLVMGIVNVTPDSFSDGGQFLDPGRAIDHARQLVAEGADLLDIGGESTRPGAEPVDAEAECARVLPVVEALAADGAVPVSIDTSKARVARRALDAGATIVNDVTALRGDPRMGRVAAESGAPLILMHMRGSPRTMQQHPHYEDLMGEIVACLRQGMAAAVEAGVREEQILTDPGIGFGKTLAHNLEILRRLGELRSLGCPILLGTSRKSFIGTILRVPAPERVLGTAATVAFGIARGAHVVRVHDVAAMVHVARMTDAMLGREVAGGS